MSHYLIQVSYTPASLKAMIEHPQDRTEAIGKLVKSAGGKLLQAYFCQGDYDLIAIAELPDAEAANAIALVVGATGALKAYKTTPLFTGPEIVASQRRAAAITYSPPA